MDTFLKQIITQLSLKTTPFKDNVFILPSKRAGLFLKKEIAAVINKPLLSPEIYSIDELIQEIAELQAAPNLELLLLLYEAALPYLEVAHKDFESFLGWGNTLLADFNEIDRNLIRAKELFDYLTATKRLSAWGNYDPKSPLISKSIQFWSSLYPIYLSYNKALAAKKIGYQGAIYSSAVSRLTAYLNTKKGKEYHFIGFNALNTAEEAIVDYFTKNVPTILWWDLAPQFLNDPYHETGIFIRKYLKKWPNNNGKFNHQQSFFKTNQIKITGVPKSISQAKLTGDLLTQLTADNKAENIAVVLADENLLQPMLNVLPHNSNKVNITMGLPLEQTPGHDFFDSLFQFYTTNNDNGLYYKDVLKFLSHPYTKTLLSETGDKTTPDLTNHIKTNNILFVNPQTLQEEPWVNLPHLADLFPKPNAKAIDFIAHCKQLLLLLKNKVKSSPDTPVLYAFYKIFNQLATQVSSKPYIQSIKAIKPLFRELLSLEQIDFQGEPIGGIQIMGLLESRNLDFEHVIITSVNEGILPSGKSSNSFIPFDIKTEFKIPTYKEKGAIYAYHFYRLLQRTKTAHIIYNTEPDALLGNEKSRFISQIIANPLLAKNIQQNIAAPKLSIDNTKPSIITKTPGLVNRLKHLAIKGFSPSSLSNYIKDPANFYKNNVLGIKVPSSVEEEIAYNTFGTIVHDTLEDLYAPLVGTTLNPNNLAELRPKISAITLKNFKKHFLASTLKTGQNLIALHVVEEYVRKLITLDIRRSQQHSISLIALEKNFKIPLKLPGYSFEAHLKGKLDRLEMVDGITQVLDYKTGNTLASELKIQEITQTTADSKKAKAFQLLCYALMLFKTEGTSPLKAGIVPIKTLSQGILPLAIQKTKNPIIDQELLLAFEAQLQTLLLEILNPNIPLAPKED